MFIGMAARRAVKPACISAETARATARAAGAAGQRPTSGWVSARYSQIAKLSHTRKSPLFRTGTRPEPVCFKISSRVVGSSKGMISSSNAISATLRANHGRNDHEE